ncbi:ribosomal protein S6 kinase 2 beta-like [Portunus trituberculatus]|uniref:ribosomal protein S6 kinase 2 beta-like n=1 Tax=Portunus trituberculatus TaxID=210409 RepID=UPI001E1D07D7|nr:ribosomal protein S6 kinase 2 beta-like [Portunus trituberculatus]
MDFEHGELAKQRNKRPASPASGHTACPKKQRRERSYQEWFKEVKERLGGGRIQRGCSKDTRAKRRLQMEGVPLLGRHQLRQMIGRVREPLGAGSYGSCFKTMRRRTQEELVIKTFGRDRLPELVKEAISLSQLQLPGVQRLVGVCVESRQLVTPFAGITLSDYMLSEAPTFADAVSVHLQTCRTLQRMHRQGFTHNDIKADNVCVSTQSGEPVATVIDVGLAKPVGTKGVLEKAIQDTENYPWIAPEILRKTHFCCEASDAFGLADLLAGPVPPVVPHQLPPRQESPCKVGGAGSQPKPRPAATAGSGDPGPAGLAPRGCR